MDLTSSWFLLLIIVLGGAVALLADHLGRTFGKKRLRWGGLRPKHTAMLATAMTGAIVTLVTIILVAAISAEAREWIVRGRGAVKEARAAVQARDAALQQLEEASRRRNEALGELNRSNQQLKEIRQRLTNSQKRVADARARAQRADAEIAMLDRRFRELQKSVNVRRQELERARNQLGAVRKTLSNLNDSFAKLDQNYDKLRVSYDQLQVFRVQAENRVDELSNQVDERTNSLGDLNRELTQAKQEFDTQREQFQNDIVRLQGELTQTERALGVAREVFSRLASQNDLSRREPMIFSRLEELARSEIEAPRNLEQAIIEVRRLLATARKIATNRGARVNERNEEAGFIEFTRSNGDRVTVDQQISSVGRAILEAPGPKLLVVRASFNSFQGEFVPVDISVYPNPVVFNAMEVVAETRIDGSNSDQQILDELGNFMQRAVRDRAAQRGMIAVLGKADSFGMVEPDEVVRLVNQLRAFGRTTRVQALAKRATRAAGPLELEFRLR